jgi:hypothetical protein
MKPKEKHLYYLSELSDYKIADNYSDIRGWEVKDKGLRIIGKVKNLLVNKDIERVVYLDVEVDSSIIDANHDPYGSPVNIDVREFINEEGENHVIIPVGLVDLNHDEQYVFTDIIDHGTFSETKRITPGAQINRNYETVVLDSYGRHYAHQPSDSYIENTRRYQEERMDKIKRRHNMGEYREEEVAEVPEDSGHRDYDPDENVDPDHKPFEEDRFYHRKEFDDSRFRRKSR